MACATPPRRRNPSALEHGARALVACALLGACATAAPDDSAAADAAGAGPDDPDGGISLTPDASTELADGAVLDSPDAAPGAPDAAPPPPDAAPQPVAITISQSTAQTITAQNSVSCNGGTPNFYHAANSYYRSFALASHGVNGPLTIDTVRFGVEQATSGAGTQAVEVKLHTLSGTFTLANLTPLASQTVNVANTTTGKTVEVPIAATAPAGSTLVVEIFTPDGQSVGNSLFIGSNTGGESGPSYIRAADCGINQPTAIPSITEITTQMHIVMSVTGTHVP